MIVLREKNDWGTEYYTGKTYIYQGEIYPCTCSYMHRHEAKKYSSIKRAENACEKLNKKVDRIFVVEEIED